MVKLSKNSTFDLAILIFDFEVCCDADLSFKVPFENQQINKNQDIIEGYYLSYVLSSTQLFTPEHQNTVSIYI